MMKPTPIRLIAAGFLIAALAPLTYAEVSTSVSPAPIPDAKTYHGATAPPDPWEPGETSPPCAWYDFICMLTSNHGGGDGGLQLPAASLLTTTPAAHAPWAPMFHPKADR